MAKTQRKGQPRRSLHRPGSDSRVGKLVQRLASQNLVPSCHNLDIWQYASGEGWGAAISASNKKHNLTGGGKTIESALRDLMRRVKPNAGTERPEAAAPGARMEDKP